MSSATGVFRPDARPASASGIAAAAQTRFNSAATRTVPAIPACGSSSQVVLTAPKAAPSVLMPYSHPTVDAARRTSSVRPRDRSGSEAPMRHVGHSSANSRIRPVAPRPMSTSARSLVEDVVEQGVADEPESGHRQLRRREERDAAPSRHAIRNLAAGEAAAAQAGHEGGDDDRRGVDVGA